MTNLKFNPKSELIKTGIVNELRIGVLTYSNNEYLNYPCRVLVKVWERDINGSISQVTVNAGSGAFVKATGFKFSELSPEITEKYQHCNPKDVLESYKGIY